MRQGLKPGLWIVRVKYAAIKAWLDTLRGIGKASDDDDDDDGDEDEGDESDVEGNIGLFPFIAERMVSVLIMADSPAVTMVSPA